MLVAVLVAACADGGDPASGPDLGTTGESSDDTTAGPIDPTTSGADDDDDDDDADDDDDDDVDSTTGDDDDDESTGDEGTSTDTGSADSACPPGEDTCPCDEGMCDFGLMCIDDVCTTQGACADDPGEDNDTEATATDLGMIEDCDDDGSMVTGVLDGNEDVDWFRYDGDDVALCNVNPARTISADGGLRLCKFAECADGETDVDCDEGTTQTNSPDGRVGCCSDGSFDMPDVNCTGTIDDDATVFIRVDQAEAMCVAYTLSYHY